MFLPVPLPHPASAQAIEAGFTPVESRFAAGAVFIRLDSGEGRRPWLLVDSGTVETVVREDRVDASGTLRLTLDSDRAEGTSPGKTLVGFSCHTVPKGDFPPTVSEMGADGLFGNDGLRLLGILVDYRAKRVYARASARDLGDTLAAALTAAGRGGEAAMRFDLTLDRDGWYHTRAVPGLQRDGAIWDTGSTGYEVTPDRRDLGPQLGRIRVARPDGTTFHGVHLIPLTLGTAKIPILAFRRRAEDPDPITIGPYALTGEWTYLDAARGTAAIPRPDPALAAARTLANLLRRPSVPTTLFGRPASEAVAGLADVGSVSGLARARRIAARASRRDRE